jgi:hypothetical protein
VKENLLDTEVVVGRRAALPFRRVVQRLAEGAAFSLEVWYRETTDEADAS